MSKRKSLDEKSSGKIRKKYSDLSGFCENVTLDRIKNMRKHPHKGDWRRDRTIRICYKNFRVTWEKVNDNHFVIKTQVPCGMTGLVTKLQSASCRSWEGLPLSVKEYLQLQEKSDFNANDFTVEVSFSGKYYAFVFLY